MGNDYLRVTIKQLETLSEQMDKAETDNEIDPTTSYMAGAILGAISILATAVASVADEIAELNSKVEFDSDSLVS